MKVPVTFTRTYEFACNSKACAPPPVGRGGSIGGKSGKTTFVSKYGTPSVTNGKWGGKPAAPAGPHNFPYPKRATRWISKKPMKFPKPKKSEVIGSVPTRSQATGRLTGKKAPMSKAAADVLARIQRWNAKDD